MLRTKKESENHGGKNILIDEKLSFHGYRGNI